MQVESRQKYDVLPSRLTGSRKAIGFQTGSNRSWQTECDGSWGGVSHNRQARTMQDRCPRGRENRDNPGLFKGPQHTDNRLTVSGLVDL